MTARRELQFASTAEVTRDLGELRGGSTQAGSWTLPQACWHLQTALDWCLKMPAQLEPSAAERVMHERLEQLFAAGTMPPGLDAPPGTEPPANVGVGAIDAFVDGLVKLDAYAASHVSFGPFGPVTTEKFRKFILIHSAHHLSYFTPFPRRDGLRFGDEEAAVADIERLRRGYTQSGKWTLAQICWHLNKTIQARMTPGPYAPTTPEQEARRPIYEQVMATGKLPSGLVAPDALTPAADVGDDAIDMCIATLRTFKAFPGPVAPHRLFGPMSDADAHKQNLIHVAHHLSHLMPTT